MKSVFRYLVAEFNGFYVTTIQRALEEYMADLKEVMHYIRRVQFKLEDEGIVSGESPIREDDVRGIGKIAGLFTPYISAESNIGSIVFTPPFKVGTKSYAERGLFNMNEEVFNFFRTNTSTYPDDITTIANERLRSSFVPSGTPILGYIAEGDIALTPDGKIIPEVIRATPPADRAYYPYYGEKYLFMAETFLIQTYIDIQTYKKLLESFQRIRYAGSSIAELCYLTETLMEDYIYDMQFTSSTSSVRLTYRLNEESPLTGKVKKFYMWTLILAMKFKQIYAEEIVEG